MATHRSTHRRERGLTTLAIALIVAAGSLSAQSMKYATWADLETWSRDVKEMKETEIGLGLHLTPSGTALLAFTARFPTRTPPRPPSSPPAEIQLLAAVGMLATPNVQRTPTLQFTLDDGTDKKFVIDLGARSTVDERAPGATINNIVGRLTPAELVRLTEAKTVRATVLGFPTEFRPDQLKALQVYARRIAVTK
jgi:hypothetical protein